VIITHGGVSQRKPRSPETLTSSECEEEGGWGFSLRAVELNSIFKVAFKFLKGVYEDTFDCEVLYIW
jgi:hypothetical protein